ncbi:IclR family transcriptional regulator [Antricoccus suffuscus]|uniref:IclR family transcriptional regulator n=1 Tax=Antricoccus suffuscus TaxID=1629062 RepID=A0A2T1A0E4_9ACTN|nr:IclR family transcriptional regulator C-terminal domain-containing protein [Antricoccus suffuscus]PRZ42070.1 IclR family transcriptional regulator [Antricoccus suffuscus]
MPDEPKHPSSQFVQSFAKGLSVIRTFGPGAGSMTLSQVAERSGLPRAGARRLLLTLQELGYVVFDGKNFSLTPKIMDLGYSYLSSMELWDLAEPFLAGVSERLDETTSAAVLDGPDIVYVVRVPTHRLISNALSIGTRLPAHATSLGRVLLGALSDDELDRYLRTTKLEQFTQKTTTDPDELRAAVRADHSKGWSWVADQLEDGLCGVAVPIRRRDSAVIAAINISTRPVRGSMAAVRKRLLPELRVVAEQIEAALKLRA